MLIMTFVTKSLSSALAGFTHVAVQGFAGVAGIAKAIAHRRAVLRLTELDERDLKDIGLMRADVEGALATSWLRDPSALLADRASAVAEVASARRESAATQPARANVPASAPSTVTHGVACGA